jgi:hypothetical protein
MPLITPAGVRDRIDRLAFDTCLLVVLRAVNPSHPRIFEQEARDLFHLTNELNHRLLGSDFPGRDLCIEHTNAIADLCRELVG